MNYLKKLIHQALQHRYGFTLFSCLTAAAITGIGCVAFMWAFEFVLNHRLDSLRIGHWWWLTTPLLFLISVEFVRRFAPFAAGTGIPQSIFAARHLNAKNQHQLMPLISAQTMSIKILTLLIAVWVGASTGREGPTVHIATCIYVSILLLLSRLTKFNFDLRSAVIAGGAAGLAAAFNTPLAGVTFAIEELSTDYFGNIKDFVLMAIIIAAIAAKSLTGEYTYFGKLSDPSPIPLLTIVGVSLISGSLGALFSTSLLKGKSFISKFKKNKFQYLIPILLSFGIILLAEFTSTKILGPGNQVAQKLLGNNAGKPVLLFPFSKMLATLLTYWSGIAGGIFAPCLSMGASLGANIGYWMHISIPSCALIGMAAFLSGSIQAPITSFVIIFEMTGHHQMLLPIMLSSLIAYFIARIFRAQHLYQALSKDYQFTLENPASK